jgi:LPPG:FO 2-phospho-L-lactate transferase
MRDERQSDHRRQGNDSPAGPDLLRVVALTGGVGGARFLRGLLHHARRCGLSMDLTVIVNTADDITLHGLRVCPDLDTVMYTLGGGIHETQGWGRQAETFVVAEELTAYGDGVEWFTLGDRDLATHVYRTHLLAQGLTLSEATARLCRRWRPGARLLPMSDERVETHVEVAADDGSSARMHFQEWWVRHHAALPARRFVTVGDSPARPAPGVLDALADADVVLLPPSNPVVSVGTILAVDGVRAAIRETAAAVVGVSPIIGGAPVRGMADACLDALGVPTTAAAVAGLYRDLLDGWLVDDADADLAPSLPGQWGRPGPGVEGTLPVLARPLLMTDVDAAADIAGAALDLAARTNAS